MGLELRISTGTSTPIYRQIVHQFCQAMAGGRQVPGDRLPSVRVLAERLAINPNTVAKAYAELVADGLIQSQQGKGYFVAGRRKVFSKAERNRRLNQALDVFLAETHALNLSPDEVKAALQKRQPPIERDRRDDGR